MANFECKVYKIDEVLEHPNADRLNIIKLKGYTCISNKLKDGTPRYKVGDLVVYIPADALLPQWMLISLDMWSEEKAQGLLSGKNGDRCKPIRLRGIFSEGILVPTHYVPHRETTFLQYIDKDSNLEDWDWKHIEVKEGDDVTEILGVKKYEPIIPESMGGEVFYAGDIFYHYDLESIMKYPNVLKEGEEVRVTEKIHGTQTRIHFTLEKYNETDECLEFNMTALDKLYVYIASKGQGDKGLCFKNNETNENCIYLKAFYNTFLPNKTDILILFKIFSELKTHIKNMTFFGETFGNVQDLHYGIKSNENNKLNIFDIYIDKHFVDNDTLKEWCNYLGINMVPLLYQGPYSYEKIKELTDGKSIYDENQIREGCVITPLVERRDEELGRVILKSVSEDYKMRKGNVTEFN